MSYIYTNLAYDKQLTSNRVFDDVGRLHVANCNISKATVNPYYGKEIPDYEKFGLDPEKKYMLLRHPDELARAATTFNNIPILKKHVPVTAEAPRQELVIGSTGTDAVFNHPYLTNSTVFWTKPEIDLIDTGDMKQLSCAYAYKPDMTPGEYEGMPYDGIMRDIVGNHVALVQEGRAGPDVMVGDEALKGNHMVQDKEFETLYRTKEFPVSKKADKTIKIQGEDMMYDNDIEELISRLKAKRNEPEPFEDEWTDAARQKALQSKRAFNKPKTLELTNLTESKHGYDSAKGVIGKDNHMPNITRLSPKALVAKGALQTFLRPRLALDAKIDLNPILEGITAKNFGQKRPIIETALKIATRGRLAQDADMEDLGELLEALEEEKGEDLMEPNSGMPMGGRGEENMEHEEDVMDKLMRLLGDRIAPDAMDIVRDTIETVKNEENFPPLVPGNYNEEGFSADVRREADDWRRRADDARKRLGRDESEEEREEREDKETEDSRMKHFMRARDRYHRAEDMRRKHADDKRRMSDDKRHADDWMMEDRRMEEDSRRARDEMEESCEDMMKHRADDKRREADDKRRDADDRRHRADDKRRRADDRRRDADDKRRAEDDPPDFEGMPKTGASKAMDSNFVKSAIANAVATERKLQLDISAAKDFVRPYVGELKVAFDSAEDVYRTALEIKGINTKGKHPDAFKTILEHLPRAGNSSKPRYAQDSNTKSFSERFPETTRITLN